MDTYRGGMCFCVLRLDDQRSRDNYGGKDRALQFCTSMACLSRGQIAGFRVCVSHDVFVGFVAGFFFCRPCGDSLEKGGPLPYGLSTITPWRIPWNHTLHPVLGSMRGAQAGWVGPPSLDSVHGPRARESAGRKGMTP